ncbi:MAG TPA: RNA polymerase sigma-70 factor [Puia sp.]|nr:RNA polymerase sigma-70 factor [Puia sp.]
MQRLLHLMQVDNDETAFREFYRENVFKLFQFAFAFVRDKELSEEIVNDVFLKLWHKRGRIDEIKNINVYLYVSVKNTAFNYVRKKDFKKSINIDDLSADHFYMSPDQEEALITDELKKLIEQSINQLPPKCKIIFKMVKEDGLSADEVADILGISYKTVTTQLSIALKKLALVLKPSPERNKLRVKF